MKRFKCWLSKGAGLVFGLLLATHVFLPQAFAADACMCFCGDKDSGAVETGSYDSANECAQTCSDADVVYVGCFTDEDMYPENNNLCWTQDECAKYPIDISGKTYYGAWGEQSAYCSKQSVSNAEMGYCYGPMLPVTLNVPIMGVTEISALGVYVNLLYEYAIPLAGIFGALMFTIAGFQYMTAGGDKGAVSKAKARMTNTVSGIILIMSVYTIAYLIDPRLTRFNELRPPLVKEAVIVDDATTCEALDGYGYDISPASGKCGEKGEISGDDGVDLNIANPPKVGDSCLFSGCDDKSKSCVIKGDKSGGTCAACSDVSSVREALPGQSIGITPSESVCSQIASNAKSKSNNTPGRVYSCYYDNDFGPFADNGIGVDECVQFYTSGKGYIDCNFLKAYATEADDGCIAYGKMEADSYSISPSGLSSFVFSTGSADEIEDFKSKFTDLCQQDVCGLKSEGKVPQASCKLEEASTFWSVARSSISVIGLGSVIPKYSCVGSQTLINAEPQESSLTDAERAELIEDYENSSY